MKYEIRLKPKAVKDFEGFPKEIQSIILKGIERMSENLMGDVKRLTNFKPEYRLRIGDYRILFEIESEIVIIYRIRHRRDAYR